MPTEASPLTDELTAAPAAVFPSGHDWRRLDYLALGNGRQRSAHALLTTAPLWRQLQGLCLDVALVSTVAIGLDRPGSDLDILCQHPYPARLAALLGAQGWATRARGDGVWLMERTLTGPDHQCWSVELYVTPAPLETLNGWRHLTLMAALLAHLGDDFYRAVRRLRLLQGLKGEAAICQLLALPGDPYQALLALEGTDFALLPWPPRSASSLDPISANDRAP
ncbi:DUF4269 domain-containing protein [Aeromonas bivalvium]|uniref:DUF4269 domain-containing protein n=1 Tax=Aeromonas bivalvium TaxID=440079 RepID=UPI00370B10D0